MKTTARTTPGVKGFDEVWNQARADDSTQSYKVSYAEVKEALGRFGATVSATEAKHAASTFSSDTVMTRPARKEASAFLEAVGAGKNLTSTVIEAIKGDFSLKAVETGKMLAVPGRAVKSTHDLPDAVRKAVEDHSDPQSGAEWEEAEVRKTTLAGQPVFIVHHSVLGTSLDLEKVQVFSPEGKKLAQGVVWDAMSGFSWEG
ncbi:MAG: hypothetical protein IPJ65_27925 [Archangiaceae bacterium]|nr:hypothetical protein [Archangiaceae bacterium]